MNKKIAIVLPHLCGGGAERQHLNLARYFIKKDIQVELVLFKKKGELLELVPSEVQVWSLEANKLRNGFFPLIKYLNNKNPDSVLAALWPVTIMTILASKLCNHKKRIIVSERNHISKTPMFKSGYNRWLIPLTMKLLYPYADAVIGVSNGVVQDLKNLSNSSSTNFVTVYNPAAPNQKKLNGIIKNSEFWTSKSSRKIIAIGKFKEQKDFPNLLKAFSIVNLQHEFELLILGEGDGRKQLEKMVKENSLENSVHLPGFIHESLQYIKSADLFVLSSKWEGLPGVLIEALGCGLPVVSTDCKSGPREILDDGKYGDLVPVGDPKALAAAILNALAKEHDPERLKKRAHYFSVERAANEYLKLLFPIDS